MPSSSRPRKSWWPGPVLPDPVLPDPVFPDVVFPDAVPGLHLMLLPRTVCLVRKRTADGHKRTGRRGQHAGGQMARNRRSIAGRPAMITGAASGIGRSLARLLSRTGSPVAIADIDEAGLKDTE